MSDQIPLDESFHQSIFLHGSTDSKLSVTIASGFEQSTLIRKVGVDGPLGNREFPLSAGNLVLSVTPSVPPENQIAGPVRITFKITGTGVNTNKFRRQVDVTINQSITANYDIL